VSDGLGDLTLDGGPLCIRRARVSDVVAVAEMQDRCTGAGRSLRSLRRMVSQPGAVTLLAELNRSHVVGVAALTWATNADAADVGLLVEDHWRGRGVGTALLTALLSTVSLPQVPEVRTAM
jgi:N-acetylglutamate synthase-like GNAT family acetyltransferase